MIMIRIKWLCTLGNLWIMSGYMRLIGLEAIQFTSNLDCSNLDQREIKI